ncbi:MAG: AMP-binding protein, partial [Candidatus Aminicenantes bacterium]
MLKKLEKKIIEDIFALTPMQEGMLFHYLKNPERSQYFEQLCLTLSGEIDIERFEKSWNFVVQTNEMLRAVFRWENIENPVQVILKSHKIRPKFHDLSGSGVERQKKTDKSLAELINEDRQKTFDLHEVAFRVTLCRVEKEKYLMIVSNHHILYDGWSNGIILKEFLKAYNDFADCKELIKPEKTKFKEFARWNRAQKTDRNRTKAEKFWQKYLSVHAHQPRQPVRKSGKKVIVTGNHRISFGSDVKRELENFVKASKMTLASLLYASWGILLRQCSGSEDVLFETTVSGRNNEIKGIEDMVGLFINTLPVWMKIPGKEKAADVLDQMHEILLQREKFIHSSPLLVKEFMDRSPVKPLFSSLIVIENYPLDRTAVKGDKPSSFSLTLDSFYSTGTPGTDLTLTFMLFDGMTADFNYNRELFDETIIKELANCFFSILQGIIREPRHKVSSLPVLAAEKKEILSERCKRTADHCTGDGPVEYSAPRDMVEKKLVMLWREVLGVNKLDRGIDANFFDFGGHSLKASLLKARIYRELKVKVPLVEIFLSPTIRQLARYIGQLDKKKYSPIKAAEEKEYYPTSPAQRRMFTLQRMEPESISYNVPAFFVVEGLLYRPRRQRLQAAFGKMIKRHESLRTSFLLVDGIPVQKIHPYREPGIKIENYDVCQEPGREVERIINAFVRPFDPGQPPLFRIGLVKLTGQTHLLMFDAHHIISDGTSMNLFTRELTVLYSNRTAYDRKPGIQYKDFSQWQQKQLLCEELKKQEAYWLKTFSGQVPVLNLPTDYPRTVGSVKRFEGDVLDFRINPEVRQGLIYLEKTHGATLYMILLAVYYVLLMKYSGQEDIIVGTLIDGRSHPDLENVIGVLIATLAARNYPHCEKSFEYFLQEVKTSSLEAFENSDYPFEDLLKHIPTPREADRNPLFDTMFLMQNFERKELALEGLVLKPYRFNIGASTFDLRLTAQETDDGIDIEIQYATRLFRKSSIRRFAGHYVNILEEVVRHPRQRLGEIPLLTAAEREEVLELFNGICEAPTVGEKKAVYQLFEDQALKTPGQTALLYCVPGNGENLPAVNVEDENEREVCLTYRQLNRAVNRLAFFLNKQGVSQGQPVGILMPPCPSAVIAVLAVWKARGAYIPIDPNYPRQRITDILADSGAPVLLSQPGIIGTVNHENKFSPGDHENRQKFLRGPGAVFSKRAPGRRRQ